MPTASTISQECHRLVLKKANKGCSVAWSGWVGDQHRVSATFGSLFGESESDQMAHFTNPTDYFLGLAAGRYQRNYRQKLNKFSEGFLWQQLAAEVFFQLSKSRGHWSRALILMNITYFLVVQIGIGIGYRPFRVFEIGYVPAERPALAQSHKSAELFTIFRRLRFAPLTERRGRVC